MNADNYKYSDITEKIIEAFYKGYNILGYGFLEKVYENALFIELVTMGLFVEKQKQISERSQSLNAKFFQTRKILFNHNDLRHQRSISITESASIE